MKRILINATHSEEIRVALCKNNHLYDFDLENRTREQKKSNIYKGRITRVEPSLEAVFVEYGSAKQGFLPLREIAPDYLKGQRDDNIKKLIKEGDELIIQIAKEERGNKGAAVSTFISLAGRYLVLMPNNTKGGGISRQISGKVRDEMRSVMAKLDIPKGMSIILRTAGIGKSYDELAQDLNNLLDNWADILKTHQSLPAPALLYQEAGVVTRAMRDYLRDDVGEIWIDSQDAYNEAASFISAVMPSQMSKLRKYTDYAPLFVHFGVERQIETAYQREVRLPSGGSIVIDQTEALVSIDINSAKSTKGADVAETAYHTNLEAADEIARQLRLRDMGGLIVIDFIDMAGSDHQKAVEKRLIDATRYDRARVQFAEISRFGLLEMSRQRLRPSLEEATGYICPRCHGNGMIRDLRSLALSIMREIEQLALQHRGGEVQAEVPTEIAAFLLNEKRESLVYLEQDSDTRITVLPHAHLESPNFSLHFNPDGFAPATYERISDVEGEQEEGRGYDINWQTPPTADKKTTNHWGATQTSNKNPSKEPIKEEVKDTPKTAVAWLSNLFAPKTQASVAQTPASSEAAAAIESLVNGGAVSLGVVGQLANVQQNLQKNDATKPKKAPERQDKKPQQKPTPTTQHTPQEPIKQKAPIQKEPARTHKTVIKPKPYEQKNQTTPVPKTEITKAEPPATVADKPTSPKPSSKDSGLNIKVTRLNHPLDKGSVVRLYLDEQTPKEHTKNQVNKQSDGTDPAQVATVVYPTFTTGERASNDPRVVTQNTSLVGTAGDVIRRRLTDADKHIAQHGFVASFLLALNTNLSHFANYGYPKLSNDKIAEFARLTQSVAQHRVEQGKTTATPTAGTRASNDPRHTKAQHQSAPVLQQEQAADEYDNQQSDEDKTSPTAYKNMIENVAGQLLMTPVGLGVLTLPNPKPKVKKTKNPTKVAIKKPKVDTKPKVEIRKITQKSKPCDTSQDNTPKDNSE